MWCAPDLGGAGFGEIVLRGGEVKPIREIGTQLGVQAVSIAYAVCWSVAATVLAIKFIDVCHGGYHLRLRRRPARGVSRGGAMETQPGGQ